MNEFFIFSFLESRVGERNAIRSGKHQPLADTGQTIPTQLRNALMRVLRPLGDRSEDRRNIKESRPRRQWSEEIQTDQFSPSAFCRRTGLPFGRQTTGFVDMFALDGVPAAHSPTYLFLF